MMWLKKSDSIHQFSA